MCVRDVHTCFEYAVHMFVVCYACIYKRNRGLDMSPQTKVKDTLQRNRGRHYKERDRHYKERETDRFKEGLTNEKGTLTDI